MTTIPQDPPDASSVARAKHYQVSQQAEFFAKLRLDQLEDPNAADTTEADKADVREAAERFVVETERWGPLAGQRGKAELAGAAVLRMRLRVDLEDLTPEQVMERLVGHFRAALNAYRRQLTIFEPVPDVDRSKSWYVLKDEAGAFFLCPACREARGDTLPKLMRGRSISAPGPVTLRRIDDPTEVAELAAKDLCHDCGRFSESTPETMLDREVE